MAPQTGIAESERGLLHRPAGGVMASHEPDTASWGANLFVEAGIQRKLRQEQAAQPLSRVVKGRRRALEVMGARESDQPVSQVLLLKQNKDDEEDNNSGRGQGLDEWRDEAREHLEGAWIWLPDLNGNGAGCGRNVLEQRVG
jgi:hypothetical protein